MSGSITATANIENALITSNTASGVFRNVSAGPVVVNTIYSDVWSNAINFQNAVPGTGVISTNPGYLPGGLRPGGGSPAIDTGTPSGAPSRDYDNLQRPLDGDGNGTSVPDMGAYEFAAFPPAPGTTPETSGGPRPPLLVSTDDGGATLTLTWGATCGNSAIDYGVYEGVLGTWYSHAPIACSSGELLAVDVVPGAGDRYYLVVPLAAAEEGGYGHRSNGLPIPASVSPCRPAQNLGACP